MTDDEFEYYTFQIEKRQAKKIASRMTTVHAALRMTAGISAITCIKDVVKVLAARFDLNVTYSTVNFLNRFSLNGFNDEEWLQTYSKRFRSAVSSFSVASAASSSLIASATSSFSIASAISSLIASTTSSSIANAASSFSIASATSSSSVASATSSSIVDSFDWLDYFETAGFDDTQGLISYIAPAKGIKKFSAKGMKKPHIADLESKSESEEHTNFDHEHDLTSGIEAYTDHDLTSGIEAYTDHDLASEDESFDSLESSIKALN